ncbi:MAG: transcription termination/antitermination protein NusG [Patescibacteria group bacterium]
MTDKEQNLPVQDESPEDPVRLPQTTADEKPETETTNEVAETEEKSPSPVIPSPSLVTPSPHLVIPSEVEESTHRHPEPTNPEGLSSDSLAGQAGSLAQIPGNPPADGRNDEETDESEADDDTEESGDTVLANVFDAGTPGHWYVLHTYSGYEDAVADSLRQRIESLDMKDNIFHVLVPKEKQIEIKNGKRKTVEKKIFPGYVLVKMMVTEASWYVVRNTPSVTGFIGSGTIPVPISDAEMETIKKRMIVEEPKHKIDLKIGDLVHITDGPFKEYDGTVGDVDEAKGKIKVMVSIFGRETPVELDFLQVKRA